MLARDPLFMVLYFFLYLAVSMSSSWEDSSREVIDHVFRIPNPDRVLKSVLGRLEKHREYAKPREPVVEETRCDQSFEVLPEYTELVQMSQERGSRQIDVMKYYPICHLERKIRKLNTNEYEYRPAYYEEVRCTTSDKENKNFFSGTNEICSSLGFSCVPLNKTIHLTRRHYSSECWETRTMVIPAGCECMWPFHRLGDISLHI